VAQSETLQNRGMKMLRIVLLLLFSTSVMAQDDQRLWETIEQLKQRIERLETNAGLADKSRPSEAGPTAATAGSEMAASATTFSRYWLSQNSDFEASAEAPLREGRMALGPVIKLNPEDYGYRYSGFFDERSDPSRYPVAAVSFEGELMIAQSGPYQLVVKPTPPREVGGAGNVEIAVEISIGGENVLTLPFTDSLATQQKEIEIMAGRRPLKLNIVARSPGFGPSPTRSLVYIGLQAENDIAASPIKSYLVSGRKK
jgi:hypothetical protein